MNSPQILMVINKERAKTLFIITKIFYNRRICLTIGGFSDILKVEENT